MGTLSSSHQMKIISILVSIAGVFCIVLLCIIAAMKCGAFDSQSECVHNISVKILFGILLGWRIGPTQVRYTDHSLSLPISFHEYE